MPIHIWNASSNGQPTSAARSPIFPARAEILFSSKSDGLQVAPKVVCDRVRYEFSKLAPLRHGAMSELSPLSGVRRKSHFGAVRAAFDPNATLRPAILAADLAVIRLV